jgi:hypothetical protein
VSGHHRPSNIANLDGGDANDHILTMAAAGVRTGEVHLATIAP